VNDYTDKFIGTYRFIGFGTAELASLGLYAMILVYLVILPNAGERPDPRFHVLSQIRNIIYLISSYHLPKVAFVKWSTALITEMKGVT